MGQDFRAQWNLLLFRRISGECFLPTLGLTNEPQYFSVELVSLTIPPPDLRFLEPQAVALRTLFEILVFHFSDIPKLWTTEHYDTNNPIIFVHLVLEGTYLWHLRFCKPSSPLHSQICQRIIQLMYITPLAFDGLPSPSTYRLKSYSLSCKFCYPKLQEPALSFVI